VYQPSQELEERNINMRLKSSGHLICNRTFQII